MRSCQHFLVLSALERARRKLFNYATDNHNAKIADEKLDRFFSKLKRAAKVNLAFGFLVKNIIDGTFRSFYEHEISTLLDRPQVVCTRDNWAKLKDFLNKTDVTEYNSRERMNTKWKFYKLKNLTLLAVSLKDVPMGCKDAVLPKLMLKNHTVSCLTNEEKTGQPYRENLCLFRAHALHFHGNQRLEKETAKIFHSFMSRMYGLSVYRFQKVHSNDFLFVEDLPSLNILLYDIDTVNGNIIGELARRSLQKYRILCDC